MTSTTLRTKGIRRSSQRQAALQALVDAGGSMELDEFRRVLAQHYKTDNSMKCALHQLHRDGFIQHRVFLTASGSALLAKTSP